MADLLRYASPRRWQRAIAGQIEVLRRNRSDDLLDRQLAALGPVRLAPGEETIIADGMWRNPNHFLRLRLFLEAMAGQGGYRLLGLLRSRANRREQRALERLGFTEFVYVDEDAEFRTAHFFEAADELLHGVRSHVDLLALDLPEGIPAYTYYDTVLKLARHPQPALDHPLWRTALAEVLRNVAIYRRELDGRRVAHVALSHPWKSEWADLVWLALSRGIPASHLTGFMDGLRIRRFRTLADYRDPVEQLSYAAFRQLAPDVQAHLARFGHATLAARASGTSTDINTRHAYRLDTRVADRDAARLAISGQTERPVVVVFGHVWYDFPHTFAMSHFTDFLDWTKATLQAIADVDDAIWLLKPHPTEEWYGGFALAEIARDLPPHVRLMPLGADTMTTLTAADAVVTVHGTIGLEAVAAGIPVLMADRSYYSGWDIGPVAASRDDYVRLLGEAHRLPRPDRAMRDRAAACFALALGEPPREAGALRLQCDSGGASLYRHVTAQLAETCALGAEQARIARFLAQDEIDSFATFHLVDVARRAVTVGSEAA
jgi:hypothetical protein